MPRTKPFYYLAEPTSVAEFPSLELSIFDYYMKDNTQTVALCYRQTGKLFETSRIDKCFFLKQNRSVKKVAIALKIFFKLFVQGIDF